MNSSSVEGKRREVDRIVEVVAALARDWKDVDHPTRMEAESKTLECTNRFTEEALVFAINQQMSLLTEEALWSWADSLHSRERHRVGVLNPGNIPFAGLQDYLAVLLSGSDYLGCNSRRSPFLLPAFAGDLMKAGLERAGTFFNFEEILRASDALIASGTDQTVSEVRDRAMAAGIGSGRILLRGHRFSVAVLTGKEEEEELIGLAEDILLHEGLGCRSVALVWAPSQTDADPLIEAMTVFRATFRAHPESVGALELQQALLEALGTPHVFSRDGAFLVSKGAAEIQSPLHIRWAEYDSLETVTRWIEQHNDKLQLIVVGHELSNRLPGISGLERMGHTQRPSLGWKQDQTSLADFFNAL